MVHEEMFQLYEKWVEGNKIDYEVASKIATRNFTKITNGRLLKITFIDVFHVLSEKGDDDIDTERILLQEHKHNHIV